MVGCYGIPGELPGGGGGIKELMEFWKIITKQEQRWERDSWEAMRIVCFAWRMRFLVTWSVTGTLSPKPLCAVGIVEGYRTV